MSENRPGPPPGGDPRAGHGEYGQYGQYGQYGGHDAYKESTGGYSGYGEYGGYGGPVGYPPPPGGHGMQPYPQDPGPGFAPPAQPPNQTSALVALVVSIMLVVSCCGALGIVGTVFSALAISEKTDLEKSRRHTRYAWIANGVVLALILVFLAFVVTAIVASET